MYTYAVQSDSVYQLLMQAALVRGGVAASYAADLSLAGPDGETCLCMSLCTSYVFTKWRRGLSGSGSCLPTTVATYCAVLDARYVAFDSTVLELLDYRTGMCK